MDGRPNILLLVSDEERANIPRPDGYRLPAHERLAERGTSFSNYYAAAAMCSSSRSVIYTGRHMPVTEIHDNDNMPYVDPLDPALGTIGTMLRSSGYYTTYQGKWHLSKLYKEPGDPSTVDALEPYGFSDPDIAVGWVGDRWFDATSAPPPGTMTVAYATSVQSEEHLTGERYRDVVRCR